MGVSAPSLHRESTDSDITLLALLFFQNWHPEDVCVYAPVYTCSEVSSDFIPLGCFHFISVGEVPLL